MFEPIRSPRASEIVVEQIARAIVEGDLEAGDQLPPERTLAWELAVSRPTLREGIRALADAGVLEVRRGPAGGAVVASDVVPAALRPPLRELRMGDVWGVLESRRILEPRVAQLAGARAGERELAQLERIHVLLCSSIAQPERFHQLDQRFHLAIARATGNETVVELVRPLLRQLAAVRPLLLTGEHDPGWAIDVHERTLAALRAADPDAIDQVMDEHLRYLEDAWRAEVQRATPRPLPERLLPAPLRAPRAP